MMIRSMKSGLPRGIGARIRVAMVKDRIPTKEIRVDKVGVGREAPEIEIGIVLMSWKKIRPKVTGRKMIPMGVTKISNLAKVTRAEPRAIIRVIIRAEPRAITLGVIEVDSIRTRARIRNLAEVIITRMIETMTETTTATTIGLKKQRKIFRRSGTKANLLKMINATKDLVIATKASEIITAIKEANLLTMITAIKGLVIATKAPEIITAIKV